MDRFAQMEFFVLTADLGSLTRAAERLCLSNAAASRMLSALENRLGVRLLERTTRRLWLTEEQEQGYYYGFANEGLWPLCHVAHVRPVFREQDWEHY